ncbi:hypothetical protein EJB05_05993, partial [Eragrostis curvula]
NEAMEEAQLLQLLFQALIICIVAFAIVDIPKRLLGPKVKHPPGPWKLPVIGSMHHLVNVLPHRALRDLARVHGPLMMLQLGETPLVVVSSREMARQVLKTHDANFATRPKLLSGEIVLYGWADILFSPSGDYWRKLRQLCATEVLSVKRVLTFRPIREQEMARQVEKIRGAGPSTPVDLSALFHDLAISVVSRASFGNQQWNAQEFLKAIKVGVPLASGFKVPDLFPTFRPLLAAVTGMRRTLEDVHKTVDSILEGVIEERKRVRDQKEAMSGAEENLVDVLIGLQQRDSGFHLNRNSIKAIIFDMFTAGTGTLASALSWGVSELMRNKRVMDKLQGEIREVFRGKVTVTEADLQESNLPYLRLVIREILRMHPPAPLLVPRESIDACEIDGYTIPARSRVMVNAWAIGRDPKCWDDPDEFKPERFENSKIDFNGSSYEYLPFGAGRRMCPGIAYGLPILEIALVQLLYHFNWSLPEGVTKVDMTVEPGLGARRKLPLLLCATPFISSETMARQVEKTRRAGPSTPVDLSALFYDLAISIVSRASFGNRSAVERPRVPKGDQVTGMRCTLDDVHKTVDSTLEGVIEERKRVRDQKAISGTEENLVDVLIGLQQRGSGFHLNRNSIKAIIFDMFTAGTGTLAPSLDWGMSELMRNKRVRWTSCSKKSGRRSEASRTSRRMTSRQATSLT